MLENLFQGDENIFFENSRALSEDIYETLISFITEGRCYEDYDKGVSIYAGYHDNGSALPLLRAIKTHTDKKLIDISKKLATENYYHFESQINNILSAYVHICSKKYSSGCCFYRARQGYNEEKVSVSFDFATRNHYKPHSGDAIGAPPPHLAGAGRINRVGVSYFYCATDIHTAITEIRPHPGDCVSIGKFQLNCDVNLFDLADDKLIHFYLSDKELDNYTQLLALSKIMNKVVPPSERQHYSITQLVADCIRKMGFDGILFKSTVGHGDNIVIFDSKKLNYLSDEQSVVKINSVIYEYSALPLIDKSSLYFDDL
ncbi:RES family NAD+ phosphorylase [Aeromonas veronii]